MSARRPKDEGPQFGMTPGLAQYLNKTGAAKMEQASMNRGQSLVKGSNYTGPAANFVGGLNPGMAELMRKRGLR